MSKISKNTLNLIYRAGLLDAVHPLWADRLTVLAYHRIADPNGAGFDTFEPNVSATPAAFAAQMDFIRQRFNVISGRDLVAWLQGEQSLPTHPLLITFDDGYRDNLDHAWPVLQQRNMPAVIFLATNYMGQATPFYWDLIAYCFYHTTKQEADLPLIGLQQWHDKASRTAVLKKWLNSLKKLPDQEKWTAVNQLPRLLDVSISPDTFAGLHLTWDQVRTMTATGIEMGAHTQSHPILTRVSLAQARQELEGSKNRIEAEINQPVKLFAYPNGLSTDFNADLQTILAQLNFAAAFTLLPGPTQPAEAQQKPLAIRRIFLHHQDTLPRFAAKVMGLPRLLKPSG